MTSHEKIAKTLKADKDFIYKIDEHFSKIIGKHGVIERVIQKNEEQVTQRLLTLGVSKEARAKEVYDALISKIEADDQKLFEALGNPQYHVHTDCVKILEVARNAANPEVGFFIKKEKARELLLGEPPRKVMEYLGYASVEDMLGKEDLFEIYSALRFIEGNEWLNNSFFKQYEDLKPEDFEEREIVVCALSEKWNGAAEAFVRKKWHNISHLKEMGVIFVIPITLGISGELLRMMSLVLHYLHEVPFYSHMFRRIAALPTTFSANLISLLRGDVLDRRLPEGEKTLWLVVQRYLAKDDENDWRLGVPRVNPEAVHWLRASNDLIKVGNALGNGAADRFSKELSFWYDLDWVGDYFKDESGNDVLVSFNLVDTVMSLVKRKELIKYLYHHQEALWNKIFMEYFSFDELVQFSEEHLLQGYFEI